MTKKDHINYWVKSSEKDGERIGLLIDGKDFVFALYSAHLSLEKLMQSSLGKRKQG